MSKSKKEVIALPKDIEPKVQRFVVGPDAHGTGGVVLSRLIELEADGSLGERESFISKKRGQLALAVGHVYDIPIYDGNNRTLVIGKKSWVDVFSDTKQVSKWQLEQKGFEYAEKAKRQEARNATDDSEILETVGVLKEAYRKLSTHEQRAGFEVWLLSQLRKASLF